MLGSNRDGEYLVSCLFCRREFDEYLMKCPVCGGPLEIVFLNPRFRIDKSKPNIWRYKSLLPSFSKIITYGEGLTPVSRIHGVLIKNERYNPTGTYSDRASSLIASYVASTNIKKLCVRFIEDFTYSLSYYLSGLADLEVEVYGDDISNDELGKLVELGVKLVPSYTTNSSLELDYLNPLTIEGLKTIIFEVYERKVRCENIVVPTVTGLLARSLWKGVKELKESGLDVCYTIVPVLIKGWLKPTLIPSDMDVVEVELETVLNTFTKLCSSGVRVKPISALAYAVAENLGNSLAVITAGYKSSTRMDRGRVKESIINLLNREGSLTAYEIWKGLKSFTLRGIYKALKSLEVRGVLCSEFEVRGSRKIKRYKLCGNQLKS